MSHKLQSFTEISNSREWRGSAAMDTATPPAQNARRRSCEIQRNTLWNEPHSETNCSFAKEKLCSVSIFRLSDPSGAASDRLARKACAGTRPKIRTSVCYSYSRQRARPPLRSAFAQEAMRQKPSCRRKPRRRPAPSRAYVSAPTAAPVNNSTQTMPSGSGVGAEGGHTGSKD